MFMNSSQVLVSTYHATIEKCIRDLEEAQYWRTPDTQLDCWLINGVSIKQVPNFYKFKKIRFAMLLIFFKFCRRPTDW